MKRIDELSREELLKVDEAARQDLIDLEIAYAGIMPVAVPVYEEVKTVDIQKTDLVYKVHGNLVRKKEDAEMLAKMEICDEEYDYSGGGYDYKYVSEPKTGTIEVLKYFTEQDVKSVSSIIKRQRATEERNASKRKEYSEYESKIKDITSHVDEHLENAHSYNNKLTRAKEVFTRHLELAEGNHGIAVNFFKTAYASEPDIIRDVLSSLNHSELI